MDVKEREYLIRFVIAINEQYDLMIDKEDIKKLLLMLLPIW